MAILMCTDMRNCSYRIAGADVAELEALRSRGDAPGGAPEVAPVAGHGGESHRRSSIVEDRDSVRAATGRESSQHGAAAAAGVAVAVTVAGRRFGRGSAIRASARNLSTVLIGPIKPRKLRPVIVNLAQ
jgi:hypothetical protein